jgi:alanine racemase
LQKNPHIKVRSVFSHLAGSDESIHDSFTENQIEIFERITEKMKQNLGYEMIRHILNSSGIERFPTKTFDMVRLGIGLYGFSPNNSDKLKNVSTFKTRISQIKTVSQGETIGYGRNGKALQITKIAIVPVGYADGYNRLLSNGKGKMLVNGHFAPTIGNVCMDMCMIDITDINAAEGDEVIIFGDKYTAGDIAKTLNTISYEVLTGISERVKRIYYH